MSTDWNENEERTDDPGLLGGGGPARTIRDDEEEVEGMLDEHGDNLSRVEEDELQG